MRVVRLKHFGIDGLAVEDAPKPTPGADELLLRVRAVSLNYRDLLMVRGEYDPKLALPLVPASDAACEVVALGAGAAGFVVGERVCPIFARGWYDGPPTRETPRRALGGALDGTLAEYIVANAGDVVRAPSHLSDTESATLGCAGVTAYRALLEQARTGAGTRVLVVGTGGVSTFALLLGRAAGAHVTVVSRDPAKLERALALGANQGISAASEPEWGLAARRASGGQGVDHVLDVGGAGTLAQSLRAVRPGGTISLIGTAAGSHETPSLLPAVMREVRLQGILVGPRSSFVALNAALEKWALRPALDRVFPLAEIREAFEHLASGRHFGKIAVEL